MSTASATTNSSSVTKNQTDHAVNSSQKYMAAGSTSSTTTTVTMSQLKTAASSVKSFVASNNRLPNYVTISGKQISMPQFLVLLSNGIITLNSGKTTSITLKSVNLCTGPTQSVKSGTLAKSEYVKLASNLLTFVNTNGRLPNYVSSSLGKIRYETLVYAYSKIIVFHTSNNRLPNTVAVSSWSGSSSGSTDTIPDSVKVYLAATANAQSTSSTIISLAKSITSGCTSTYAKASAIFNWVKNYLTYSFYYNTRKGGALTALSAKTANCCDHSHLVVALARAAGIPARYQHGYCHFSDGWFGHVWAQLYVGGKWYSADAINDNNSLGVITNWNTNTYTLYGTYAALPF